MSYNGAWGTICDNSWDLNDAHVVCRSLGYIAAVAYKSDAYYGQGSGNVWLETFYCDGSESSIADCKNLDWGNNLCSHNRDAGVICASGTMFITIQNYFLKYETNYLIYYNIKYFCYQNR